MLFKIACYFKTEQSSSFKTIAFLSKLPKYDVTETRYCKKYQRILSDFFFLVDVKLLLGKVLKISRRYLRPFLSYRENPAVSAESAPPPPPEWDAGYCTHPGAKRHFYKYFNCN